MTSRRENYEEALALQRAHPKIRTRAPCWRKGHVRTRRRVVQQGRYPEAERMLRDALATQKQLLGSDHGDIARTLQNLAKVVGAAGDLKRPSRSCRAPWTCNARCAASFPIRTSPRSSTISDT